MDSSDDEVLVKRRRVNKHVEKLEKILGYAEQRYFDNLPITQQLHLANLFKKTDTTVTIPIFFRAMESIASSAVFCPSERIFASSKSGDNKDTTWAKTWIQLVDIANSHTRKSSGTEEENESKLRGARDIIHNFLGPEHPACHRLLLYFNNTLLGRRVGKSLGLYGPAGNGKTTIATKCVSQVLERPVVTIPLGGCNDVSKLVGHNFTYEGSRPGAIIQGILDSKCLSPIFLLDELDKVGKDEVTNALLHIIDETQNDGFLDNYMGFPVNISESIFIFTYNDRSRVSPILLNRIDQLHIPAISMAKRREMAEAKIMPGLIEKYLLNAEYVHIHPKLIDMAVDQTQSDTGLRLLIQSLQHALESADLRRNLGDTDGGGRSPCIEIIPSDLPQKESPDRAAHDHMYT